MTEQDYKLLAYIHQYGKLSIIYALQFPPNASVARKRLDKLEKLGYIRYHDTCYSLTPTGEILLEDYLLEQNRQQQPQEPTNDHASEEQPTKTQLPFGLTAKEVVLYLGFPLIIMLIGFWLSN